MGQLPMIEVEQPTSDSCLRACIACIVECDVGDLPDVDHSRPGKGWLERYNRELRRTGLSVECIAPPFAFRGYWIAEVPSLNHAAPGGHAVVMRHHHLRWDPSVGEKYERVVMADVRSTFLVVPVDLAGWDVAGRDRYGYREGCVA